MNDTIMSSCRRLPMRTLIHALTFLWFLSTLTTSLTGTHAYCLVSIRSSSIRNHQHQRPCYGGYSNTFELFSHHDLEHPSLQHDKRNRPSQTTTSYTTTKTTTTTTTTTWQKHKPFAANERKNNPNRKLKSWWMAMLVLLFGMTTTPPNNNNNFYFPLSSVAHAASYSSLTPEQKFIAEAWRTVDATFLDRTFNGMDWFQLRQDLLLNTKYKTMEQAQLAVSDMISKLGDKYTKYLSPAKYQSIIDTATGTLAGVGVEIATNKQGQVIVSDVEPNSPAQKAGLLPKDIFVQGDGYMFDKTSTPDDVALKLRGPPGSKVGITILRPSGGDSSGDEGETKDFIITREPIKVTSVRTYVKGTVGVIRIKSFSGTTASTVQEAVNDLKKKGAKTLVFDLRSNPGGLLPGGVETASLFLPANKPLVFVVSNKGVIDSQETFKDGIDLDTPIIILVDHNTASAAEVFTAAIQENGRGKVVGEQTFGKGIIQTIRELSNNNGGVAVTVARYETPQHHDINKAGIPVDIETNVECPKDDALACLPASILN